MEWEQELDEKEQDHLQAISDIFKQYKHHKKRLPTCRIALILTYCCIALFLYFNSPWTPK